MARPLDAIPQVYARTAGVLYLVIIVFGLLGELVVRAGIIVPDDPAMTADRILSQAVLFRGGFVADSVMVLSDVALAVLLYVLLAPVSRAVALMAMCFRLAQAAVLALNLVHYHAALLLLTGQAYAGLLDPDARHALAALFLDLHGHGYDIGLLLFGVHCLLLGYLVYRSGYLPRALGGLLMAAAVTYLLGSYTRFLLPEHVATVAPIYVVAIVAEVSVCLWLLIRGVDVGTWMAAGRAAPVATGFR